MLKVYIQIPAWNEENLLPTTVAEIYRATSEIANDYEIRILVIDDGSTDSTAVKALELGTECLKMPKHVGLARAFSAGLDYCVSKGADFIINTDADNQYPADGIALLLNQLVIGNCDIVIGNRITSEVSEFTATKKGLQHLGSSLICKLNNLEGIDVTSGFRGYSRLAATEIMVQSKFSYTIETLFSSTATGLVINSIAVGRNNVNRPSRLFKSNWHYIRKSVPIIVRCILYFRPLLILLPISTLTFVLSFLLSTPYLLSRLNGSESAHIQSLIATSITFLFGSQLLVLGFLADAIAKNRAATHKLLRYVRS